jgi:hypothetical protein
MTVTMVAAERRVTAYRARRAVRLNEQPEHTTEGRGLVLAASVIPLRPVVPKAGRSAAADSTQYITTGRLEENKRIAR